MIGPGANGHAKGQVEGNGLIKPMALKPGDTVGFITPATPIFDPDLLAVIKPGIESFGLKVKVGNYVGKRTTNYEDNLKGRLDDLHSMFADPEIKGIVATGGYGASQLLDRIDYNLIRSNPKIFIGYSDVTALHLAIHKMTKLVTFHGAPTVESEYTQRHVKEAIFETEPVGLVTNPEKRLGGFRAGLRTVQSGKATAPLMGGNLSLIAATMSTPYEIETDGTIFFIEDVNEEPYRVDRMLTHLRLAGKFDRVKGVVWGICSECGGLNRTSSGYVYTLGEVIDNLLKPLCVPVLSGMTIGHTSDRLTLPIGVQATLDSDHGTLDILESGVI
jgi:muramoyltetrapeptide carboxypeptidase